MPSITSIPGAIVVLLFCHLVQAQPSAPYTLIPAGSFDKSAAVVVDVPGQKGQKAVGLAAEMGRAIGKTIREGFPRARVLGSTDLTHHGGHFGSPGGRGKAGVEWAVENDRRMLDLLVRMDAEAVVAEARDRLNACGPWAIAATIAAARELGAARGHILHYTTSFDVMREKMGRTDYEAAVGYVGAAF